MNTLNHFFVPLRPERLEVKQPFFYKACENYFYFGRSYRKFHINASGNWQVKENTYTDFRIRKVAKVLFTVIVSLTIVLPLILLIGKLVYRNAQEIHWMPEVNPIQLHTNQVWKEK